MKYKIIADTRDAYNVSSDRKRFDFDLRKGVPINEKSRIKFESATNIIRQTEASPFDPGLLVIGGLVIDETTNQNTDYGGDLDTAAAYARTTILDLDNSEQCSVVKNSDGTTASSGSGGALKLITFKDYGDSPTYPKRCVVAQVIATGSGYQTDEHILVKQAAFPTGYRTSTTDMRIDINRLRTSEIKEPGDFKEAFLTIQLDSSYIGEAFGSALDHPSVSTGQGSFLTLGRDGSSAIRLVSIDSGGYGFQAGDIFWVPKEDALPSFIPPQFYVPIKIEVLTAVAPVPPTAPGDPNNLYKIALDNIMFCDYNVINSNRSFEKTICNSNLILYEQNQYEEDYKVADIPPQVLNKFSLVFTPAGIINQLNNYSDYIVSIIIS